VTKARGLGANIFSLEGFRHARHIENSEMQIGAIAFTVLLVAAACATGVEEPYFPDGGDRGRGGSGTGGNSTGRGGSSTASTGSGATGGQLGTGGTAGAGARGGSSGSGPAARGGAGGGGGSSGNPVDGGATGCPGTADWQMGNTYAQGDKVRAVCSVSGTGTSQCTMGKTYMFTCNDPGLGICALVAPGAANWWLVWALGSQCN
jgi:hypothetical protein